MLPARTGFQLRQERGAAHRKGIGLVLGSELVEQTNSIALAYAEQGLDFVPADHSAELWRPGAEPWGIQFPCEFS